MRAPHPTLRHRDGIRLDVKRARKERLLARRPGKQARREEADLAIMEWCRQNYLLSCSVMERLMRLLWEEFPFEDEDDALVPG